MRLLPRLFITAILILFASASAFPQTARQGSATKPAAPQTPPKTGPGSAAKPATGQAPATQPTLQPRQQQPAANPASVPADAPVITVTNVCDGTSPAGESTSSAAGAGCTRTITKAEFEKIADAVNAPAQAHDRLAQGYVRLLIMSAAAEKRGLDKDPKMQTMMTLARLQAMAQELNQRLQKQASEVPPDEIEKYYREHAQDYEQVKVRRLVVPKSNAGKPLDEAKQKQLADALQKRAAAGEDFDKLQKEAFTSSGMEQTPPPTDLGQRRRGSLPKAQDDVVFGLQSGHVSAVAEDPMSFYIYKAESKDTQPLDSASQEIKQRLAEEKYSNDIRSILQGADAKLNPQYFGTDHIDLGLPPPQGQPGERPRPVRPASPQQ